MKSNEKLVNSTRWVALASPDIAANATQKPNEERKRVLEEHEVYTPMTKRIRKAQDASENANALDTFGSIGCMDLFGKRIGNERAFGVYYTSIRFPCVTKKSVTRRKLRPSDS